MKVTQRAIDSITPYANNPRINDAAVDKVAASLSAYGWRQPIVVDGEGVVIVQRWETLTGKKATLEKQTPTP